jgi:hypothetical protein
MGAGPKASTYIYIYIYILRRGRNMQEKETNMLLTFGKNLAESLSSS